MEIKEVEKILQESADNIKVRDFSQVWQEIKGDLTPPPKKVFWRKRFLPAILSACILLFVVALPVYLLLPKETVYYHDKLVLEQVLETEFNEEISNANISHVNFDDYYSSEYMLFLTEDNQVKGGYVVLYDDINSPTEIIKVKFYDKSVDISEETDDEYNLSYSNDGLSVIYKEKESYPQYNIYIFDMKASFNNVNYVINYTGNSADLTNFFNTFFVK